jgi:hypothetical protein
MEELSPNQTPLSTWKLIQHIPKLKLPPLLPRMLLENRAEEAVIEKKASEEAVVGKGEKENDLVREHSGINVSQTKAAELPIKRQRVRPQTSMDRSRGGDAALKQKRRTQPSRKSQPLGQTAKKIEKNRRKFENKGKDEKRILVLTAPSVSCPVCEVRLAGNEEENASHVEMCLSTCHDEEYEEYTWGDVTRIRAVSLLPGSQSASTSNSASTTPKAKKEAEEDLELNVDEDESRLFGSAQYTEKDIIKVTRKTHPVEQSDASPLLNLENEINVGTLKKIIKSQGDMLAAAPRCLICLDWFVSPASSIICWHVHCEACWLKTLGSKRLCPQCNTITSPSDLRRVYF